VNQSFNKLSVYGALAAGLIAIGFAPILVRLATHTSPITLVTYRTVFAAVLLLPYWAYKRELARRKIPLSERIYLIAAGVCLGFHFTCWLASLYYTSVAAASVLVTIHPVLIILVERLWFKRPFAWTSWLGVFMAFLGSALLGIFDSQLKQSFPDPTLGNILAISAAFFFAAYLFLGQKIRQKRAWIDYVFPVYSYAGLTCLLLLLITGNNLFDTTIAGVLAGLGLALGPSILGHGSMNYAVKYIAPTLLSTLVLVEPLLASVLAYFLFNELPRPLSILAMVIVLTGVSLTWKRRAGEKK